VYLTPPSTISPDEADLKLDGLKAYGIQTISTRTRDNAHIMQTITLSQGRGLVFEERLIGPNYYENESSFPANEPDLFKQKFERMGFIFKDGGPVRFQHKLGQGQGFHATATTPNGDVCFIAFGGYTFGNDLRGLKPHNYQALVTTKYCAGAPDATALVTWLSSIELRR
jgi:hypothetical protein